MRPTPSYSRVLSGSVVISAWVSLACFWTRVSWSICRSANFTFCCVSIIFTCSSVNACRREVSLWLKTPDHPSEQERVWTLFVQRIYTEIILIWRDKEEVSPSGIIILWVCFPTGDVFTEWGPSLKSLLLLTEANRHESSLPVGHMLLFTRRRFVFGD